MTRSYVARVALFWLVCFAGFMLSGEWSLTRDSVWARLALQFLVIYGGSGLLRGLVPRRSEPLSLFSQTPAETPKAEAEASAPAFLPYQHAAALIADLKERFPAKRREHGPAWARTWYCGQILLSILALLKADVARLWDSVRRLAR